MNKKRNIQVLSSAFRFNREAVCGVQCGKLVFANPAAASLFGRDVTGERADKLFPQLDLDFPGDTMAAALILEGKPCGVTAVRCECIHVLTIHREAKTPPVPAAALSQMRAAAFNLRMALDRLSGAEAEDPYTAALYHSYYSLLHVADRLSDVNALSDGSMDCRMAPLELGALVCSLTDSVSFFTSGRRCAVTASVPEEHCFVSGDRERLEQLILILLANSLYHSPREGQVRLILRRAGKQITLTVEDEGGGLSQEELAHAFAPRDAGSLASMTAGTGLGLHVAQGIAQLHGGALVLQSTQGEGARASLSLPALDSLTLWDAPAAEPSGPQRILTELCGVLPSEAYRPLHTQG